MKESFLLRNYYGRRQDKNIGSADHTEYDKRIETTLQHIASGKMPVTRKSTFFKRKLKVCRSEHR